MKQVINALIVRRRTASESGNVLFLILIAVALFAALSYAVTQSSRSGSGDANSEKSLVSGAEVTQYPAGVRTSIVRMVISNNVTVDQLYFDDPSTFTADFADTTDQKRNVFHPNGGGATYQMAPAEVMANNVFGQWYFNANFEVPNIGITSTADSSGNDLIAWLPGLALSVCQKIDDSLGLPAIPVLSSAVDITEIQKSQLISTDSGGPITQEAFPTAAGITLGATTGEVSGQPFACFQNGSSGPYIYYHVLIER